tara:strand:- start:2171 stop:2503 length:333 start_codon:yes stop_codon:yes gene_type:complete
MAVIYKFILCIIKDAISRILEIISHGPMSCPDCESTNLRYHSVEVDQVGIITDGSAGDDEWVCYDCWGAHSVGDLDWPTKDYPQAQKRPRYGPTHQEYMKLFGWTDRGEK